jgi:hypothetical protein
MCCFAWFGWSITHHFQKYTADRQESLSHGSIVRLQAIVSKLTQLLGDKPAEKVTESVAKDAIARWSESATTPSALDLAVSLAIETITDDNALSWFHHCGLYLEKIR